MPCNAAVVDRPRRAVALAPRLLSLREAIVLAGIDDKEKDIRNDLSRGVFPTASVVRIDNSHLCFTWPYVLTFAAVYGNRLIEKNLRKVALERVYLVASGGAGNCTVLTRAEHFHALFDDCFVSNRFVNIDNFLDINLGAACETVKPRMNLYIYGLDRVEEDDAVLGGAAVFKDTRLSVLHIGKLADRGIPMAEILEDYASLTENDVEFAKLYFRARPPVGRPAGSGVTKHDIAYIE